MTWQQYLARIRKLPKTEDGRKRAAELLPQVRAKDRKIARNILGEAFSIPVTGAPKG